MMLRGETLGKEKPLRERKRDKRIQALVRLKAMTYEEVMDDRVFLQRQREWEERRVWV